MQRELFALYASLVDCVQYSLCEMQSCSRCCHRTFNLGIHRLVSLLVAFLSIAVQVWRNRQFAYCIEEFCPSVVAFPCKLHNVRCAVNAFSLACQCHLIAISHHYFSRQSALFPFLQVAYQTVPLHTAFLREIQLVVIGHGRFQAEHLYQCSLHTCLHLRLAEMQTSLNHLSIVEHHQRSLRQI